MLNWIPLCLTFLAAPANEGPYQEPAVPEAATAVEARAHTAPRGARIVTLGQLDRTVHVYDAATLERIASHEMTTTPHEVVASGQFAYVMLYGAQVPGREIAVLRLSDGALEEIVHLGAIERPHGAVVSGGGLYLTSETTRAIARFDFESRTITRVMGHGGSGGHMLALAPDASFACVANILSDDVSIVPLGNAMNGSHVERIEVAAEPEPIAISPDGRELWLGHRQGGLISIVDLESRAVAQVLEPGTFPYRIVFTPEGDAVVWTEPGNNRLVVAKPATRQVVRTIPLGTGPTGIWLREGGWAYVSLTSEATLAVVDLVAGEIVARLETGVQPDGVVYVEAPAPADADGGGSSE